MSNEINEIGSLLINKSHIVIGSLNWNTFSVYWTWLDFIYVHN